MGTDELVKAIRKQMGWSQSELGNFLGVGRSQVCNIETGRNDIPASKLLKLLFVAGWDLTPPNWALEAQAAREKAEQ
jgi:transcriptional regulator with XRE-family HTH domain